MQVLTCTKTQYMAVSLPFASQRVCYALCTMQSKQGKANAALSILSRPKLFCSSGFTFTWRTSTCTRPPTSRKTQHEMVIQFAVSFNTHPQLKKHKYQIPIFLQNSHRKTLIPVQHKIQAFSVLETRKYKNTDFQLSLSVKREATNSNTQIRPELQIIDNQAKIQIPDDFTQFRCK